MKHDCRGHSFLWVGSSLFVLLLAIIGGCAHIVPPAGGPYDMDPPILVRSTPQQNALDVSTKRVTLYFDEYIKLEDVANKVIISPPQLAQPKIRAIGKRAVVDLEDDLIENTTYTIDFTDAIVDNNEGNPLENFSFAFSTGNEIDTMEIAGTVLDARTLEPMQGLIVGIHPEEAGWEAFTDTTFLRMSRTSDRAKFVMRNVKQGTYSLYALRETDGNYRHDMATEGIAFLDSLITTSSFPDTRMDTLWIDTLTIDTITEVAFTHYLPDDVVLRYFEAETDRRFISKRERPEKLQLKLTFNAPLATSLRIKPVDSLYIEESDGGASHNYVLDNDPSGIVHVFFTDSTWGDYGRFELRYLSVDSLNHLTTVVDTLQLPYRAPRVDRRERIDKKDDEELPDSIPAKAPSPFTVRVEHKGDGGIGDSILFITSLPIDTTALRGIEIYNANDSILQPISWEKVELLPGRTTVGRLVAKLSYNTSYEIYFDSLSFRDVYGHTLDKTVVDAFKTKGKEEFSHLNVTIQGVEGPFIGELLSKDDKVERTIYTEGNRLSFRDLNPNTYGLRIILDRNGNGRWDPGDYSEKLQPEWVYYMPKLFELMKNWELNETFNPLETPLSEQKPKELIQNKPKERKRRDLNAEREEQMRQRGVGGFGSNRGMDQGGFGGMRGMGGMQNYNQY